MTQSGRRRFRIRDARPEEFDEVSKVILAAYREYRAAFPREVWEAYASNIADVRSRLADSELIVAQQAGRIVGAVTFYPPRSEAHPEGWPPDWCGVRLLAVLPDSRGQGIGEALMRECVRRCRARGSATLGLHTTAVMAVARRMYERMGFVRAPEHDFHPRPGVTVMAYRLGMKPTQG